MTESRLQFALGELRASYAGKGVGAKLQRGRVGIGGVVQFENALAVPNLCRVVPLRSEDLRSGETNVGFVITPQPESFEKMHPFIEYVVRGVHVAELELGFAEIDVDQYGGPS